jgi:hypothetical protein
MRASRAPLSPEERRDCLRADWARLLGEIEPAADPVVEHRAIEEQQHARIERLRLTVEPGIVVSMLVLSPVSPSQGRRAVVVGVSQHGKAPFIREQSDGIAVLLAGDAVVCLPDLRGTGETSPAGLREPRSSVTQISATEWMLGQTLLGSRLRDLRSVLRFLRTRADLDPRRFALWGDSFAPVNPTGFLDPLLGEEEPPFLSEPMGGLLALFGALYEEGIAAVAARNTLAGYLSVLEDGYCYVPHDDTVPGALTAGDLCDVAAALSPCPLRIEGLVDGRNCRLPDVDVQRLFEPAVRAYQAAEAALTLRAEPASGVASWLLEALDGGIATANLRLR